MSKEVLEAIENFNSQVKNDTEKLEKKYEDVDGVITKLGDDIKTHGSELSETKESFQDNVKKVGELEKSLEESQSDIKELIRQQKHGHTFTEQKSLGMLATESPHIKNYEAGNFLLATVEKSFFDMKMVSSDPDSAGTLKEPLIRPGIMRDPDQPLMIRDLMQVLPISTDLVKWYQEKSFDNQAKVQANEGDIKAQSNLDFEQKTSGISTIAHWIPVSNQILADVKGLRAYIDSRMRYGLALAEERQILFGDGLNDNLLGLMPQATPFDVALSGTDDTNVDQIRRAILQVAKSVYPANGIIMTHSDWADIELSKTADKAYLFANPVNRTQPRLWGRRVVESYALPDGEWLVGSLNLGATLWDREKVTLKVADQHADYFIRNMIAILVEERIGLSVERPKAIVNGVFA